MTGLLTLVKMLLGFFVTKIVAIHTGPSGIAMLGQVQGLTATINGVVSAPLGNGIVRFTAENYKEGINACTPWWRASLQWFLFLLLLVTPSIIFLAKPISEWLFQDESLYWLLIVMTIALPFSAFGVLANSIINGQQNYRRYVLLGMISALTSSLVMIFLILTHRLNGALLAVVIQSGLIGIIMLIASIKQPWFKIKYWWAATEHKHKKAIGGYVLMAMTSALTKPVSLILIRNSLVANVGWEQAGQWQAVWKISEVYLAVITIALGTYFLPRLASISGVSNIRKEINNTARIVLPIVCVLAFSVFLLRDVAIYILYTEEFKAARDLFGIQLIGDVLKVLSFLYAYPMISRGATKWFVTSEILFSLTFVILGFVFIQSFGTQGANIAYLVSYFLYFLIIYLNLDNFSR